MSACGICGMSDLHRGRDLVTGTNLPSCNSCGAYLSSEEGCWVADCESCGKMTADVQREADRNYCPECHREMLRKEEEESLELRALKAGIHCLDYFVTYFPHLQSDDVDKETLTLMRQAVTELEETSNGS